MKDTRPVVWTGPVTVAGLPVLFASLLLAASPQNPKPSSYAPAKDLQAQIEEFIGRVEEDLADQSAYGMEQQERVVKDANTLVALAQVLGWHDEEHELKKAAPTLVTAATTLAENVEDYREAKNALGDVKNALKSASEEKVAREPVADLAELMKQVPIVNNSLRRGVTGRRFSRLIDRNAGYAATLAVIAQVSMFDRVYCADEEDEAKWAQICAEMRDAAAEVNVAVRKNDKITATAALEKLVKTCDKCHHAFRD